MTRPPASLQTIVAYCDRLLRVSEFTDWEGAANGLQVENSGTVTRAAAAVDATLATVRRAVERRADLLIVHHGLFWGPTHPWTGKRYELIRLLLDNNLALYSSHLPLDAHPRLGNNAIIVKALGLRNSRPFFVCKGRPIGLCGSTRLARSVLAERLRQLTQAELRLLPCGPEICRRIGIVSGGAGAELREAVRDGVDTFITGEGPHWTFGLAEELGVNVLYAGHYATETFGVKALAAHLSRRFSFPWEFIHHPSGL